jgi:hypothetical protein
MKRAKIESRDRRADLAPSHAGMICGFFSRPAPLFLLLLFPWYPFSITPSKKGPRHNGPRALMSFCCFGNPAIPGGPVAFRPTIARGLALSVTYF